MPDRPDVDLADLLANPVLVDQIPMDEIFHLLGRLECLKTSLLEHMRRHDGAVSRPTISRLLTVPEVADRSGMSPSWWYSHAKNLAFTRHVGRALRFDERGFERWLSQRRACIL